MKMNISTRIIAGYLIAILFSVAIGVVGIYQLKNVSDGADHMYVYNTVPLPKLGMSFAHFQRIRVNLRDILLHKGDTEMHKKLIERIGEMKTDIKKELDEFDAATKAEEIKKETQILHKELEGFYKIGDAILEFVSKGDYEAAIKEMDKNCFASAKTIEESVNKLNTMKITQAKATSEANHSAFKTGLWVSIGMIVFAAVICIIFAILIVRSITKPLTELIALANNIASGDLSTVIEVKTNDEIGQLLSAQKTMVSNLREMITKISETSFQVASASNQLHSTSEQMATGAEQAVAQCSTVATAVEEMSATSSDIAKNCQSVADGSKQASNAAVSGAQVVDETIDVMKGITDKVTNSAKAVESLGERSDQIGNIIGTIEDIADQTNLLALNAAIEAARAGEQGRGFAVVADEVRALAERTTNATREIGEMIKAIQKETKTTVSAMEEGVKEVATGGTKAALSGKALEDILNQVNEVTMQINQVATAAEEQTATTTEISNNMQHITNVISQTSRGAQDSVSAANQLSGLAEDLRKIVGQFKL